MLLIQQHTPLESGDLMIIAILNIIAALSPRAASRPGLGGKGI